MESRRIVQAALAAWAFKGLFLDEAEAFKTQRPRDVVFSSSFDGPSAMLEMQWGSDYVEIPGTTEADGSFTYVFANSVEGTVMEPAESVVDLSEENSCAAVGMQAEGLEQHRILKLVDIPDANECQRVCSKNLHCQAAQFNSSDSTCVLLKSLTGLTRAPGTVVVLASCNSDCFSEEEKLSGDGSSLGTVPNANMCQALCASNAACKGFTYTNSSKQCLSFPEDTDLSSDEDAISGSKTSCTSHVQATNYTGSCSIPNMSGTDLPQVEVVQDIDSYEQCRKLCLTNPKCNYLTFNSADRRCYVKTGEGTVRFMKAGDTTGPRLCDGSCFLENIKLTGEAFRTVKDRRSAHFCHYDCSTSPACAMWSFHEPSKTCFLYAENSGLTGRPSEGMWTGPKSACPSEALYEHSAPRCSSRGVRFENEDPLRSTTTQTAEECASECANSPNCEAFAYNVQQKKCDHLRALAELRREDNVNYISGARVCAPSCFRKNTEYTGTPLGTLTGAFETAEQCQLRCQATAGCTSWNFTAARKACTLFNSTSTRTATGTVGGTKYCDGACDLLGHRLNTYGWTTTANAGNLEACRQACKNNSNCRAVTLSPGFCNLYDEFAFVRLEPLKNHNTAIANCSSCFKEGVGYQVNEATLVAIEEARNAEECRIRCTFWENCTRFTYNAKTNVCSLLSGEAGEIRGANLVSGPASCQTSASCARANTSYEGGTSAGVKAAKSLEQCQQLCEQTPKCKNFNYQTSTNQCQMFTGDNLKSKTNNGWVAGKKKCQTLSSYTCVEYNKDYYGADLSKSATKVKDVAACRDVCQNDPACETWMFYSQTKDCWRKTLQGYVQGRTQSNTISGSRSGCPVCARWQRQYTGRVVGTKQVPNEAVCQMECKLNNECNFFTFGPQNSCKLYADEGTVQSTVTNIYSGPKRC